METLPNNSAFPEIVSEQDGNRVLAEVYSTGGLTIRAYIATKAMQGLASVSDKGTFESHEDMYKQLAEHSVKIADALIEQLNK